MTSDTNRLVAFYLPQYYPTAINSRIYGEGHTEWDHVKAARPLFPGHHQPVHPGELGFYDLRSPEVRMKQANLARQYGISAFCYWSYWSDGERQLELPLDQVSHTGEPRFPFCLAWANHHWRDITGRTTGYTFLQKYGGSPDYVRFFRTLERFFHDDRYFTVDGRCLFYIFRPFDVPDIGEFTDTWRRLAEESGLKGFYFVGQARGVWDPLDRATISSVLDAMIEARVHPPYARRSLATRAADRLRKGPVRFWYSDLLRDPIPMVTWAKQSFPCVITNWDNTPRWGRSGVVLRRSEPQMLELLLLEARRLVADRHDDGRIIFLKSWNEWAEGNYLEPDITSGLARLEAIAASLERPVEFLSNGPAGEERCQGTYCDRGELRSLPDSTGES